MNQRQCHGSFCYHPSQELHSGLVLRRPVISFGFRPTTHPTLESAFTPGFASSSGVASIYLGTPVQLSNSPPIMLSNASITGERGVETPSPTLTSFLRRANNPFNPASSTSTYTHQFASTATSNGTHRQYPSIPTVCPTCKSRQK